MAFKDNLRRLRIAKGFNSRRHFAEKVLEIGYTTYNGYEVRGTLPPEELIVKIAQVLNVTIDELFGYNPIVKKKDIDIAVEKLNRIGIKSVIDEDNKEVGIYFRRDTRFTSIPYDKVVDIIKSIEGLWFLNSVKYHVVYSFVMKSIIDYADPKRVKRNPSVKLVKANSDEHLTQVQKNRKPFTKKQLNEMKRIYDSLIFKMDEND